MSLESLTHAIHIYRYWILIPLSLVEGPIVGFLAAVLAARGELNVYAAFGFFVLKDLIMDGGYYYAGRYAAVGRLTARVIRHARVAGNIERCRLEWERHAWRTMVAGKLCWGVGPAVLSTGGIVGVPIELFLGYALAVAVLQYGVLFSLGYTIGYAFQAVSTVLRTVQIVLAVLVIAVLIYARRRVTDAEERRLG